jgi:hypothetical protein
MITQVGRGRTLAKRKGAEQLDRDLAAPPLPWRGQVDVMGNASCVPDIKNGIFLPLRRGSLNWAPAPM